MAMHMGSFVVVVSYFHGGILNERMAILETSKAGESSVRDNGSRKEWRKEGRERRERKIAFSSSRVLWPPQSLYKQSATSTESTLHCGWKSAGGAKASPAKLRPNAHWTQMPRLLAKLNYTCRVGEDTFEMYLRYRYTRGCIFCIFQILRHRYH